MNKEFLAQTVRGNTYITDRNDNRNLLLYKEAYHLKRSAPSLNNGLKASREGEFTCCYLVSIVLKKGSSEQQAREFAYASSAYACVASETQA